MGTANLLSMTDPLEGFPPAAMEVLRRHNLLRTLVERQVIEDAVQTTSLTPQEQEAARSRFMQAKGIANEEALQAFLASNGLTPPDLAHQCELPVRIQRYCQERFGPKAEARFLSRKNQLDRVVYSLLRVRDPLLARELFLRIAGDEATFAELAALHTEGPEKATHGIVGPVPLTQAHPVLAERLRISAPGRLQEPFQIAEWWLIVRLENYTPATFNEAMAAQMAGELFTEWVQEETLRRIHHLNGVESHGLSAAPA
jgi:parvulin-like peptidyl-prolyl isomerase